MTEPPEAVIVGAEIAAGHDGHAELIVRVRHENGVIATVTLDGEAGFRLMDGGTTGGIANLIGLPWRRVLAATLLRGSDHV